MYDSKTVDLQQAIHQALDTLIAQKYQLDFNGTQIKDILMIAFPGVIDSGGITLYSVTAYTKLNLVKITDDLIYYLHCSTNM